MRSSRFIAPLVALVILSSTGVALGDDDDWAEAGQLFHEARALMQKPDGLNKACELLTKSYELRQRGDTLLNLAECHRRQNKTATAWREFDEAIKYAEKVEFKEAIEAAAKLRDELATKLSSMMVDVPVDSMPKDLAVVLDGKPLPSAQWGQPLFVDPGTHSVSASATGYEPFEQSVEVSPKGGERAVIKIELKKIPERPKAPPPKPPPPKPPPPPPPPEQELPIWAIVVGSAGVAMMGVSIGFGVDVVSVGGELDDECGDERDGCPAGYDFESARSQELRSFGLFVGFGTAGIVAAGVGAIGLGVGFSSGGDSEKPAVSIVPWGDFGGGGIALRGVIE
jgi:hypothetical protein